MPQKKLHPNHLFYFSQLNVYYEHANAVNMIEPQELTKDSRYENFFTHLIVIGDFDYLEILEKTYSKIIGGAIYLAFSQCMESLTPVYANMMETKNFTFVRMYDSFMREYQVLPNRTHPKVNMSGFSGFVLHGFKS